MGNDDLFFGNHEGLTLLTGVLEPNTGLTTIKSDLWAATDINASTYNKEHIIECIKEGLKYGTIEYKDIIMAIKEVANDR